jgi:HD domain
MLGERVRLADLLAAVSVATDLGMGQEPEKAIRACLVATALARRMGTAKAEVSAVYQTALLRHLGCTATAHEEAYLAGDELGSRPAAERADFGKPREAVALLLQMGRGTGFDRVRYLARALRAGKKGDQVILGAVCEVGARLAERLSLGSGVRDGLYQSFERWDGKETPQGLAGEDICLPARLAEVAHQAVIFDRLGGPAAAVEMVRRPAGELTGERPDEPFAAGRTRRPTGLRAAAAARRRSRRGSGRPARRAARAGGRRAAPASRCGPRRAGRPAAGDGPRGRAAPGGSGRGGRAARGRAPAAARRRGEGDPAGGASEQAHAELLLQPSDVAAEGLLRPVQPGGGAGEMQLLGDRHELAQQA